jgi:hypothetical protein
MEFNKQDLQDWISEKHDKYWSTPFKIKDMYQIEGKWARKMQHTNGDYFVRIFWLDLDNYTDYWDYPIEDYKSWIRDKKINKLLQ